MKVLMSSCLLGFLVRYDGLAKKQFDFNQDIAYHHLCPEVLGGLSIPRERCEIRNLEVVSETGVNHQRAFEQGAKKVLEYVLAQDIDVVVFKENSPSCGSQFVYDGSFQGIKVPGMGVTTRLLRKHGIVVLNENQWEEYLRGEKKFNESI